MRTKTETLVKAMRAFSNGIQSVDGVVSTAISEAADRLEELQAENNRLKASKDAMNRVSVEQCDELEAEVERLRVEVESLKPYRDNHHDFMQHMARHDAAVLERFARDLGVFDPEYDDQGYIEVPRYAIKDYINKLRQQAEEANDFAESEIKRFQENQRVKEWKS